MAHKNIHLGRIGVYGVGKIIEQELKWFFREQETEDYGIDAQIEICDDGGPTGKLIALQIKCGKSYFQEKTSTGYVYRGVLKHLKYWLNHDLPVVLVLYDHEQDKAVWTYVDNTKITLCEKTWSIEIPMVAALDAGSASELESIITKHMLKRKSRGHWPGIDSQIGVFSLEMERLITTFCGAQISVDIATSYIDREFLGVLRTIARSAKVRIAVNQEILKHQWISGVENELICEGIEIRVVPSLHEKLIVLDNSVAIWGSANMTRKSWDDGYELMYATSEAEHVSRGVKGFEKIWKLGSNISVQ